MEENLGAFNLGAQIGEETEKSIAEDDSYDATLGETFEEDDGSAETEFWNKEIFI